MDMSNMYMGSMSVSNVLQLLDFPKIYWAIVGSVIGVATLVNLYNQLLYHQRLKAARAEATQPAKPKARPLILIASIFAIIREASNFCIQIPFKNQSLRLPTLGRTGLVLANLAILLVLCFLGLVPNDRWSREKIAYRCGVVTIAQLPLIFVLASRINIIGYLAGVSHERLNWLHRWCARCLLLTATLHMAYLFADWAPYNYIGLQLKENTLAWKGVVAWGALVWIVFSSMAPIRKWRYELFVVQHLTSFAVFITFVYVHTPPEVHVYIWISIGFFGLDRALRTLQLLYVNLSIFDKRQAADLCGRPWRCRAEFIPLTHKATRVIIRSPTIAWLPGQHVFLSFPSIAPLQNHPFTITTIVEDGRMEFLIKAENGVTKRLFQHAQIQQEPHGNARSVLVEGPYGALRPLRQFDSVLFLAGSTGATFTVPLACDILQGWKEIADQMTYSMFKPSGAVTRRVRFVWVVKSSPQLGWFSGALTYLYLGYQDLLQRLRDIELEVSAYVTCDKTFTEEYKFSLPSLTIPKSDLSTVQAQNQDQYGKAQSRVQNRPPEESEKLEDEMRIFKIGSSSMPPSGKATDCRSDGSCLCQNIIEESSSDAAQICWCSNPPKGNTPSFSLSPTSSTASNPKAQYQDLHPSVAVYAGRPDTKLLIRKTLEQALGESAVVVCGPRGLVTDVKQHVCELSDERAVHKGTGAQGIYLHTESFGY